MDEKYQRIRVLGKGSFGKAYLVKNTEADELCVVKQMETSMMGKKEREEAVKEAMLLKRMDHRNIVKFQEVFMTRKGRLCIVMDYADGGDVHMEIKRRDGNLLPEAVLLEWFVQTCFALKHVHDRKVLHRDLKTQNIFLMATGQVKLGDFGIARVLDATKDYAKTMVGTPYYLSPEIIEDRPYNFKSDIWSLGVVLYEMATLKHPFDADSLVILASKILKDQYPPLDAQYSADLTRLLSTMLSKDAKVRPYIRDILALPFLWFSMTESNRKYNLDMDLSEFEPKAPEPPQAPAAAAVAPAPAPAASPAEEAPPEEVEAEEVPEELPSEPSPTKGSAGGGEDEYDEDFEDYSEGEDPEEHPQSALQQSVANLKLGGGPGNASTLPAQGSAPLGAVAEEPAAAGGIHAQAAATAPVTAASAAAGGSKIGAKAVALRKYLREQVAEADFQKAYALVRASADEVGAEEMQRRVGEVIGPEKAPELFTLFQLLCFLEDVASNPQSDAGAA